VLNLSFIFLLLSNCINRKVLIQHIYYMNQKFVTNIEEEILLISII